MPSMHSNFTPGPYVTSEPSIVYIYISLSLQGLADGKQQQSEGFTSEELVSSCIIDTNLVFPIFCPLGILVQKATGEVTLEPVGWVTATAQLWSIAGYSLVYPPGPC